MTAGQGSTAIPARALDEIIAVRREGAVTVAQFLAAVNGLAAQLPSSGCALNICASRYEFLVGFAAALARGLTTWLPPNPLPEPVNALHRQSPGSFVLTDNPPPGMAAPVILTHGHLPGEPCYFEVSPGQLAAVAFTSGSTGVSLPREKTWSMLTASTAINMRYYLPPRLAAGLTVVSTVPPQHMYGFESTVLPALLTPVTIHESRPFFPADVLAVLREAPAPAMLVSTPVHLRALAACGLTPPALARVVSATAPLEPSLAAELETLFSTEVVEIYGCTEVGSMAWRRPARSPGWQFFDGLHPAQRDDGVYVGADHLPEPVRLPDALAFDADDSFTLVGRDSDLVKIGGKRSSLGEVTRHLLGLPGVIDAVAFTLPEDPGGQTRLAALLVAPGVEPTAVRAGLRPLLDAAFMPRPILMVTALPRAASGKLPREAVLALYAQLVAGATRESSVG